MTQIYLTMPQPGETITEGTIVEWKVKPGDEINENTPLVELETDKAVFDYESPFDGTFVKILHPDGTRVKVAEPIAIVDSPEDRAKTYITLGIAKAVGDGPANDPVISKTTPDNTNQNNTSSTQTPVADSSQNTARKFNPTHADHIKMSPYVRKIAAQHHIQHEVLIKIAHDNVENRVTKNAIERVILNNAPAANQISSTPKSLTAPKLPPADTDFSTQTCSAIRMRIADNMVLSKAKIPHAHTGITADLTDIIAFRDQHKESFKQKNQTSLNLLSLIYPALVNAIKEIPIINASYDDSQEPHHIKIYNKINLGIAVGTEHGLVIPVLKDIGSLNFKEFNTKLADLVSRAQKKKLMPNDLTGSTLIFNNYGFYGTQMGVQVIQYPLAATLGMGAIEQRVVPINGEIKIRTMSDYVLSFDHRVMDGRETGMFLSKLKSELESLKQPTNLD
ncbi:hypothetical protein BVY03_02155 [bacterium K02(2017)]|nr:hypothetical protein BVY03_02155 [bacterium K02(2017)]